MFEQGDSKPDTPPDDEQALARAAERAKWPVRMGKLAEMEGDDYTLESTRDDEPNLSASTTVEERFAMMWQLAKEAWAKRGDLSNPSAADAVPRHE